MDSREIVAAGTVGLTTRHDAMRIGIEPVSFFRIDEDANDRNCGPISQKLWSNACGAR